jgi:hypothetical protein
MLQCMPHHVPYIVPYNNPRPCHIILIWYNRRIWTHNSMQYFFPDYFWTNDGVEQEVSNLCPRTQLFKFDAYELTRYLADCKTGQSSCLSSHFSQIMIYSRNRAECNATRRSNYQLSSITVISSIRVLCIQLIIIKSKNQSSAIQYPIYKKSKVIHFTVMVRLVSLKPHSKVYRHAGIFWLIWAIM